MIEAQRGYARIAGLGYAVIFALAIHANFAVISGIPSASDPDAVLSFVRSNEMGLRLAAAELMGVLAADVVVAWAL